jgi:hypothetical protein
MRVNSTFQIFEADTGKRAHPTSPREFLLEGRPLLPTFAVTEGGRLAVLLPDGTYMFPAGDFKLVVQCGVSK